jgi:tetratricopeptide (TPR) repeat protein
LGGAISQLRRTTSWTALVYTGTALVLLAATTAALNGAYRRTRLSRAEARYRAGMALASAGRHADAADDFRVAMLYEHDDPRYRLALAQSLVALKRWNEAGNYLFELRAADPTSAPLNLMQARIAAALGHDQEAIEDYHRAIFGYWPEQPVENRVSARLELIRMLDRLGEPKAALAELLEVADEVPEADLATRRRVAAMLLAHGSPQHAAEVYRAIVTAYPRDAAAREGFGETEFARGDFAGALAAFHAAVRYGSITPALAGRIALLNSILELDPTPLRLGARQRLARARALLARAQAAAGRCRALPAAPAAARGADAAETIALAQAIWKARMAACPRQPEPDQPLAILMNRMPNQ